MIPKLNEVVLSIPEALSIYVNQIAYDKKNNGERVYTYSLGEAFFDIPRFKISDEDFSNGYHYSNSLGQLELREKIADLYKNEYSVKIDPNSEILISAGSKPVIFMLLCCVLSSDDEVLVHEPAWLSYKEQIKLASGKYVSIPYYKSIDDWEKYITNRTKVIVINNPNNPSGNLYSEAELKKLHQLAEKYNLFILSDEAYSDFLTPNDKFISYAKIDTSKEHCLVVNSLSKNMGISGWRIGYAICHKKVIKQLLKLNQHLITCAPSLFQNYLSKHFDEILKYTIPQANKMAIKRSKVQILLDKIGIKALKGVGTFYFLLDVSSFKGTTDELVYDLLLNNNIATVSGIAYGESTKDFIRFGIGVEDLQTIEESLKVIKSFLDLSCYDSSKIRIQMNKIGINNLSTDVYYDKK